VTNEPLHTSTPSPRVSLQEKLAGADISFASINQAALLRKTSGDRYIWGIVVVLALMSLLVVYSATGSLAWKLYKGNTEVYLFKQLAYISLGFIIIYFAHRVNYTVYARIAKFLFWASVPLLLYTLFFGATINEGSRWIKLPIINLTIQTSDFARLALFMYLALLMSKKQEVIKDFKKGFLPLITPVIIICGLIAPANLSTALLTGAASLMLMFIGRVSIKHILLAVGVALIPVILLIAVAKFTYTPDEKIKQSSVLKMGRVGTWVKRVQDYMYATKTTIPYQVQQANIAIANGGILFGLGPGRSTQKNFLPHPYSDYIYATIIEEYGLLGAGFLLFIYMVFLFRCIRLFKNCPYAFGAFLALGLSFTLVIQALTNMAVNVGLMPVTGVTLPLVSMGGSSFFFTSLAIGIILSVARNVEQIEGKAPLVTANETEASSK
jgi:cell division protein FtsW